MRLGFIGTGAITEAIVMGLLRAEARFDEIILSERSKEVSQKLARQSPRISVDPDNQSIADRSDILFLAVRPQVAQSVLSGLDIAEGKQIISLIAAVPSETLRGWLGTQADIVRAIPLPAVAQRRGVTAIFPHSDSAENLFAPLGTVVSASTLTEFNTYGTASALMGTYFGLLANIADWMENSGADRAAVRTYLASLFLGLAQTTKESPSSFEDLRLGHSTPNGLNALAHQVFGEQGGYAALDRALANVLQRVEQQAFLDTQN